MYVWCLRAVHSRHVAQRWKKPCQLHEAEYVKRRSCRAHWTEAECRHSAERVLTNIVEQYRDYGGKDLWKKMNFELGVEKRRSNGWWQWWWRKWRTVTNGKMWSFNSLTFPSSRFHSHFRPHSHFRETNLALPIHMGFQWDPWDPWEVRYYAHL